MAAMVETTINAQTVELFTEAELARLIRSMRFDQQYAAQIVNFFTDLTTEDITRFMIRNKISERILKEYYQRFISPHYENKSLEEMLRS